MQSFWINAALRSITAAPLLFSQLRWFRIQPNPPICPVQFWNRANTLPRSRAMLGGGEVRELGPEESFPGRVGESDALPRSHGRRRGWGSRKNFPRRAGEWASQTLSHAVTESFGVGGPEKTFLGERASGRVRHSPAQPRKVLGLRVQAKLSWASGRVGVSDTLPRSHGKFCGWGYSKKLPCAIGRVGMCLSYVSGCVGECLTRPLAHSPRKTSLRPPSPTHPVTAWERV